MAKGHAFQAPTGTRDFYPQDMLRRRYIEKMWRDTSIRHGFEEIDGPTFEPSDLYAVKSGDGILGELFQAYSGKSPDEVAQVKETGRAPYALRPEFTPTLARMYAAKAGGLPKPTKWFWQQNCFRAERPQRGRLREFLQWNVDFVGDGSVDADSETLSCCVNMLKNLGLSAQDVRIKFSSRFLIANMLTQHGVKESDVPSVLSIVDRCEKVGFEASARLASAYGLDESTFAAFAPGMFVVRSDGTQTGGHEHTAQTISSTLKFFGPLFDSLNQHGIGDWCEFDNGVVRGLAYYTGMVFEVHEAGGKERAIAGGGRYDNLIELFGGPPTPAVGFGMGDVVLSLVLQDKGLMPEGAALMDKLAEPPASPRPDVFVIANDQPESIAAVRPLVAGLRRGEGGRRPLHARHSYKATKNIGKLLQEASACHSRFAAILESGSEATLKNLTTGEQVQKVSHADIAAKVAA
jgi:histidyl-tRNA synthetase